MDYEDWKRALSGARLPALVVDLDAFERNARAILGALGPAPVTIRLASKSIRVPALLRRLQNFDPRFRGIMAYSAAEAEFLAARGFDDLLIAYPPGRAWEAEILAGLCADGRKIAVVVDDADQIALLGDAGRALGVRIPLCIDVDGSWRPLGLHVGVRRSPVRSAADALNIARTIRLVAGVSLAGVMCYEAQVAGLRDRTGRAIDPAMRWVKARSRRHVARLRGEVRKLLGSEGMPVSLVNGGGTGSVASTAADGTVTEVTAGSGFLCPHLFDGYDGLGLTPAEFLALPIVRRSDPDHVTAFGGGIVASGEAGADRLPIVHLPAGLVPLPMEGFGEVQTPFRVVGTPPPLGAPVICRPAKAGEPMERFSEILLIRDGQMVGREPTYRGLGGCFG